MKTATWQKQLLVALTSVSALALAALIASSEGASIESTLRAASQIPLTLMAVVLGLSSVNYLLRFLRWEYLVGPASSSIPRARHLLIYLAGFSLTLTPAKAGEALRTVYLLPYGISAQHSLACLGVERLLDVLAVALLAVFVVELWPPGWAIVAPTLVVAILGAASLWWIARRRPQVGLPAWVPRRLAVAVRALSDSFGAFGGRTIARTIPPSIIGWGLEAVGLILLAHHFAPQLSALLIVGIFGAAVLGGALTFLPGGLGGTEALMIALLITTGMGGPEATAVTAVCRLATLWFGFGIGLLALLLIGIRATREQI